MYHTSMEQQLALQSRRTTHRRTVDHGVTIGKHSLLRLRNTPPQPLGRIRPEATYLLLMLPPAAYPHNHVVNTITKFVHLSLNKAKHAIHLVAWTPEGRRLVVTSHSGEFTIWNGMTFNFETIMQAHDLAIFLSKYLHAGDWLLSGDQEGVLKIWQPNFNNVKVVQAHADGIRDIAFLPNDARFVTCSDDTTLKIWNFHTGLEERTLAGHHWDVKLADWHPHMGLVVSGSKDNLIKLWDPRASEPVSTLHGFKHTVAKVRFQTAGLQRLLASVSRDRSLRVYDLRNTRDCVVSRSAETDLSGLTWHPVHANIITTGTYEGAVCHYDIEGKVEGGKEPLPANPFHEIPHAHEKAVHALEYHPVGHILCSAGADRSARFWCRARPFDPPAFKDPTYTDDKNGAWYYSVNNHVNGVIVDETAPAPAAHEEAAPQRMALPGLNVGEGAGGDPRRRPPVATDPRRGATLPGLSRR